MKRFLATFLFVLMTIAAIAQDSNTIKFLGIPVDGTKNEMISKLQAKGYKYDAFSDNLFGEFNGTDVIIYVQTINNKVWRIGIGDANVMDEADIKYRYNRLFKQIIVSNPAIELESKSIKRMNDSTLVIGNVSKNNVSDIVLFDSEKDGVQRIIMAGNSDVKKSSTPGVIMQLDMNSPIVLSLDKSKTENYESISAEKLRLNIFEDSIISSSNGTSPREMTSWDLIKRIKKMKQENSSTKKRLNTFILECNKKFSVPFGSFFFALLAFPLALIFGKKDGQTLGLIFGIILSVLYWSATIIGQMFGIRGGYNGFWMMWTPNFVIGILGIILYIRLKKK